MPSAFLVADALEIQAVKWNAASKQLSGVAKVIGGEPFRITVANNGHRPVSVKSNLGTARLEQKPDGDLSVIVLSHTENADCSWQINYE